MAISFQTLHFLTSRKGPRLTHLHPPPPAPAPPRLTRSGPHFPAPHRRNQLQHSGPSSLAGRMRHPPAGPAARFPTAQPGRPAPEHTHGMKLSKQRQSLFGAKSAALVQHVIEPVRVAAAEAPQPQRRQRQHPGDRRREAGIAMPQPEAGIGTGHLPRRLFY
ncbi:MAG: hypothetical protein IPH16_21270 [Haliscomenobacter sp.]|nr:hypothetical protein [Haliscomenobacter sp.]